MLLLLCSPINKEQPQKLTSFLLKYFSAPSLSDNTNFRLRNCPLSRPLFHRNPSRYPAAESNCWELGIKRIAEKRDRIKNRRRTLTSKPSRSNARLDRTRQKKQVFPSDLPCSDALSQPPVLQRSPSSDTTTCQVKGDLHCASHTAVWAKTWALVPKGQPRHSSWHLLSQLMEIALLEQEEGRQDGASCTGKKQEPPRTVQ